MPTYDLTATQKSYKPKLAEDYKASIENLELHKQYSKKLDNNK